ncbi:MAG: hypothetical protein DHS20C15_28720 [Planctomycetota bacterium]|nr:MAG: hypothetical protein DHS20C15_28720 [Planctomycetota bacterium]
MLLVAVFAASPRAQSLPALLAPEPAAESGAGGSWAGWLGPIEAPADESPPSPWRMDKAIGTPAWLTVSGAIRARYEHIDGQFRSNPKFAEDDQLILLRTNVKAEARFEGGNGVVELMDSRQGLATESTPLGTAEVNTLDVLQAYVEFDLGALGDGEHKLRVGRETIDLGSRRFVARNGYRNTIQAFTGVDWMYTGEDGSTARAFWTMPVMRRPGDLDALLDNDQDWDTQSRDMQFLGLHGSTPLDERTHAEAFVFYLHESDRDTRRRRLTTPGFRVQRKPEAGEFDYEVEAAYQFGRSASSSGGPSLDHSAHFEHVSAGYTFQDEWTSRLGVALDHATGDRKPTDGDNQRYDSLFGPPRPEFGPTNLWRAFVRSNVLSPELRWSFKPCDDVSAFVAHRGFWLASDRDAWVGASVRDPSGDSGDYIGQQLEVRARIDVIPKSFRLEFGAAHLFTGSFPSRAAGGSAGDSNYVYSAATWFF